jgi:hypothetical protein
MDIWGKLYGGLSRQRFVALVTRQELDDLKRRLAIHVRDDQIDDVAMEVVAQMRTRLRAARTRKANKTKGPNNGSECTQLRRALGRQIKAVSKP